MARTKIDIALTDLAELHTSVRAQRENIKKLRSRCRHTLKLRLQYPIPVNDGRSPSEWWIHIVCATCDRAFAVRHGVPLCPTCEAPMRLYRTRNDIAREIRRSARQFDRYAKKIYVFECTNCSAIHGFPTRVEVPKKKPSPA